ncbi:MAG: hemin uptake protein HemP [Rhodoferax sp.]|nr:hemin uptake protein HemP [Rhodoferax sp.]
MPANTTTRPSLGLRPAAMGQASASPSPAQPEICTDSPALAVKSTDLLRGQKMVAITHNGLTYRLQATRLGKLILTK